MCEGCVRGVRGVWGCVRGGCRVRGVCGWMRGV